VLSVIYNCSGGLTAYLGNYGDMHLVIRQKTLKMSKLLNPERLTVEKYWHHGAEVNALTKNSYIHSTAEDIAISFAAK